MKPYLGMYVHMHWGYAHPYAARTWSLEDWRAYASGLAGLGYNLITIWPLTETMPDPPTPSDVAHLEKLGAVITMLQREFGMTVLITFGANTVGNERAAHYSFEERPFFQTDQRLNPADPAAMDRLMRFRASLYRYLAHADGMVIIDSDPGGWAGSTNAEFSAILRRHLDLLREVNPGAMLWYWVWVGWQSYNRFWEQVESGGSSHIDVDPEDWAAVVEDLCTSPEEQWRLLVCWEGHRQLAERLGIEDRSLFYPYGAVESEPTFPLTNFSPRKIEAELAEYPWGRPYLGAMANAQTHVAQLPNTYLFSHFAQGGAPGDVNLAGFAEKLIPGVGGLITDAWLALDACSIEPARALARVLRVAAKSKLPHGELSGLFMGNTTRFLEDLALQLAFSADISDFAATIEAGGDGRREARALVASWRAWMERTGFVDAYGGPVADRLHPALAKLGDADVNAVLSDFDNWHDPAVRNGIGPRLLKAVEEWAN
jgi:hypothetical protein